MTTCPDCQDAVGIKPWHNHPEEVWWMAGRLPAVELLCSECWHARDNREGAPLSFDEALAKQGERAELLEIARRLK